MDHPYDLFSLLEADKTAAREYGGNPDWVQELLCENSSRIQTVSSLRKYAELARKGVL